MDNDYDINKNKSFGSMWFLYFVLWFSLAMIPISIDSWAAGGLEGYSPLGVGLLVAVNLFITMIGNLVFGYYQEKITDKYSRKKFFALINIIMLSGFMLSVFAINFTMLIFSIMIVAIGGGAFGPVAFSMINDFFPARERGTKAGLMNVALIMGSGFGVGIGVGFTYLGVHGWRIAWCIGPILGLLALFRYFKRGIDPERGRAETQFEDFDGAINYDYKITVNNVGQLLKKRTISALLFFQIFSNISTATLGVWGITYLTTYKFGNKAFTTFFLILVGLMAIPASYFGGKFGDKYSQSGKIRGRVTISMIGLIFGMVCNITYYLMPLSTPIAFPLVIVFACLGVFLVSIWPGNHFAIISDVCAPELRSSASALNGVFVNTGGIIGNLVLTVLIQSNLALMPFAITMVMTLRLCGSFLWLVAYYYYPKEAKVRDELMVERRKELELKK